MDPSAIPRRARQGRILIADDDQAIVGLLERITAPLHDVGKGYAAEIALRYHEWWDGCGYESTDDPPSIAEASA